jgi:hypothetical protein
METSPSNTTAEGWNQLFDYTLEKQYQTGQNEPNNYDITISFQFNEEDKLSEVFIDRKFFATMPKWMFIASIKALGNSNVDTHHRKISGNYNDPLGAENLHIADANEVLLLLGIPYTQDSNSLTYKYELHHRLLKMEKPNYCP